MGEIADSLVERMISGPTFTHPDPKTCNRCGMPGLYWEMTRKGWRLFRHGERHICRPSQDDIDLLDDIDLSEAP